MPSVPPEVFDRKFSTGSLWEVWGRKCPGAETINPGAKSSLDYPPAETGKRKPLVLETLSQASSTIEAQRIVPGRRVDQAEERGLPPVDQPTVDPRRR
jgi:hypothetical protein